MSSDDLDKMARRARISAFARHGTQSLYGFYEPEEMFGEQALVEKGRRIVSAIAELRTDLLLFGGRDLNLSRYGRGLAEIRDPESFEAHLWRDESPDRAGTG